MKKSLMFPFLFAALLVLCACTQGAEADAPTANAGITLTLRAAEHPELDFGMAGEQRALMDFAVGTDGLVYLLGQDGQILAYRADGTLAAEYDLALRQQGLTACRIAAGDGVLYLLDGHNNVILTVEQGKIKTVSVLGFSDVGMVKSLYVDWDGVLWLSFANIEGAYTAAIDPSGDEAKIVGETQPGYLIGPDLTYLPEFLSEQDEAEEAEGKQLGITLYQNGQTLDRFCISPTDPHRSITGLQLYGPTDDDRDGKTKYAGMLLEFVNETDDPAQEQLLQTPVLIDPEAGTLEAAELSLPDEAVVEPSSEETYRMAFSDEALTIQPIGAYFSGRESGTDYVLTR